MPDIGHIVVLMLENRSFDCMLGRLYPGDPGYGGLTLNESNRCGMTYGVWTDSDVSPAIACTPDPDPGELFADMGVQLYGSAPPDWQQAPTMDGFALNYGAQPAKAGWRDPGAVMHYFTPDQVPALSTLAKAFGVCDQWHASAPCQTWPNRFFTHTGTSLGYVDNGDFPIPFTAPSLFRKLEDQGIPWRVYFHDMPQSILLRDVWTCAALRYRPFGQFLADAQAGKLPAYSFIEPQYFTDLFSSRIPNDEHPPHDVRHGNSLIAQVYNALRSSPCWKQSLLIVTYDEHGGCFDHVPPPISVPPDAQINNSQGFGFIRYGVRVPAVIVSPYIPPGTRIRAPQAAGAAETPFDHTSIIKTVRETFGVQGPLTDRDAAAPSLLPALTLAVPNNDGPRTIPADLVQPSPDELSSRGAAAPNGMQASLAAAASHLPATAPVTDDDIPPPIPQNPVSYPTVARAQAAATACTLRFLGLLGA